METAGSKQPAVRRPGPSDASCWPRSAQPRPPAAPPPGAPHFAVRGEHPHLSPCPQEPGVPLIPAHLPQDPTSPPPRSHSRRVHNQFPPALPPSEDGPVSPGACGAEPQRALPGGGEEERDTSALKVNSNTACKLLGCSPERAPAGTLPQRRAIPQGLPRLQPPEGVAGRRPRQPRGASPSIHLPKLPELNPIPPRHRQTRAHSALPSSL